MRNWQESGVVEEDNQGLDHHGAATTNNWSTQQTSSSATIPQQRQEQQSLHISIIATANETPNKSPIRSTANST